MKPNGTVAAATALEAQIVGAVLAGGADVLLDLPAGFSSAAIQVPEFRRTWDALVRLNDRKVLPNGPVDRDLVLAEAGLKDEQRTVLEFAEFQEGIDRRTLREYAEQLLDKQRRSVLLNALGRASRALADGEELTADVVANLTGTLLDLDHTERPETVSYREALLSTIDVIDAAKAKRTRVLSTGFEKLDRILHIRPGNLVVLAARPKVGKTTLARQIARSVALRREHVLWHGLEMDAPETVALDISAGASIDSLELFDESGFTNDQWSAVTQTMDRLAPPGTDGFIHANHYHHTLASICRITEKEHRRHGLSLVVIDYLQLVAHDLGRNATRENVVSAITRTLKLLAQRLGVPILALSQLNRESVTRPGDRARSHRNPMALKGEEPAARLPPPQLHDLRESGAIEQDANAVVFLHHPLDQSPNQWEREHGPFELIVAAQRLGPQGSVCLHAERAFSRFKEV